MNDRELIEVSDTFNFNNNMMANKLAPSQRVEQRVHIRYHGHRERYVRVNLLGWRVRVLKACSRCGWRIRIKCIFNSTEYRTHARKNTDTRYNIVRDSELEFYWNSPNSDESWLAWGNWKVNGVEDPVAVTAEAELLPSNLVGRDWEANNMSR